MPWTEQDEARACRRMLQRLAEERARLSPPELQWLFMCRLFGEAAVRELGFTPPKPVKITKPMSFFLPIRDRKPMAFFLPKQT
jgi:hypothetical protein